MKLWLEKKQSGLALVVGVFHSNQLVAVDCSGAFFTVPDITDVRGEQKRWIKDSLEMKAKPKNLAPIQSIIKKDSDFLERRI
jgi:hypothetical protein